jgi:hypothetical protein
MKDFQKLIQAQFDKLQKGKLFRVTLKSTSWNY